MGALDSAVSALGSVVGGTLVNQLNRKNAIEMQNRQNEYNHPLNQVRRLAQAGFNPARVFADGQSIENTSDMASVPDASSGFQSASSTMQAALQARLLDAQVQNIQADTKKKESETALTDFDTMFKKMSQNGQLELLDASVREKFKNIEFTDAQIKNLSAQYEKLMVETDEIEANIDLIHSNASKMKEETALIKLEQAIKQQLADSQVKVNEEQIRLMAKQGYAAAMSGKVSEMQEQILGVQKQFAYSKEFNETSALSHRARFEAASADIRENEKVVSDNATAIQKYIAPSLALTSAIQQVFGLGAGAAGKIISTAASAIK